MPAIAISVACAVLAFLLVDFENFFLFWISTFLRATRTILKIFALGYRSEQVELVTRLYFNWFQVEIFKL